MSAHHMAELFMFGVAYVLGIAVGVVLIAITRAAAEWMQERRKKAKRR